MNEQAPPSGNTLLAKRGIYIAAGEIEPSSSELQRIFTARGEGLMQDVLAEFLYIPKFKDDGFGRGKNWLSYKVPSLPYDILDTQIGLKVRSSSMDAGTLADRQIMLLLDTTYDINDPILHILANERIQSPEPGVVSYLTEDMAMLKGRRAQHTVDTNINRHCIPDMQGGPAIVLFDTAMRIVNYQPVTQPEQVTQWWLPDRGPVRFATLHPFGDGNSIYDQLDAITSANGMMAEIIGIPPSYYGVEYAKSITV